MELDQWAITFSSKVDLRKDSLCYFIIVYFIYLWFTLFSLGCRSPLRWEFLLVTVCFAKFQINCRKQNKFVFWTLKTSIQNYNKPDFITLEKWTYTSTLWSCFNTHILILFSSCTQIIHAISPTGISMIISWSTGATFGFICWGFCLYKRNFCVSFDINISPYLTVVNSIKVV